MVKNPGCIFLYVVLVGWCAALQQPLPQTAVDVGVILDLNDPLGKITETCMVMAFEDFYASPGNHTKYRLVPHVRDSKSGAFEAASAGVDLLTQVQVQAILGPQTSAEAHFVIDLGDKARVPIISSATSPTLSPRESPFFVRAAHSSSDQAEAIAEIAKAFGWSQAVIVYEDSVYGSGIVPFLTDALLRSNTIVTYRSVICRSASNDDQILLELYKLKTMQTRVFVVHLLPDLASRLFIKAKEAGMMSPGYAWIITESLTSLLNSMDSTVIDSMQGVLGLKPYAPISFKLGNFSRRWRKRFRQEHPEIERFELNAYGLWAYDSVTALAMAAERINDGSVAPKFKKSGAVNGGKNLSDLEAIGVSEMGSQLVKSVRNIRFNGVSGDFHIKDGQLQRGAFQIVNIVGKEGRGIGFWTAKYGISKKIVEGNEGQPVNRSSKDNLELKWPGESRTVPKGWEIPTSGKKLKVGVPVKRGLPEFIKVESDPQTHAVIATGFCVEVFEQVMKALPYAVPFEFVPFGTPGGDSAGVYDDLVYQIFLKNYDAVVGDVTILANRSNFVDFTLPYTESGVTTVVRMKADQKKNAWIFTKPLTMDLWLTTAAFFIFTGFVVWALEHRINREFRGPPGNQVGMIFWFSFSTLVFANKEKVMSNLSRFVMIIWVFVVLVLTSSYTASLTSMLTVQHLQPTVTDFSQLIQNGEYIGYQTGSFVTGLLKSKNFDDTKFRNYDTFEEYDEALSKGSRNGGVGAIVDELPYIRLFLNKYSGKYTMVGPIFKTAGFGFAFPKGSPLVPDVSRAVLKVTEGDKMRRIEKEWLGDEAARLEQNGTVASDSLTLDCFKGLFLIAGLSLSSALAVFLIIFLHENRGVLGSDGSIIRKLSVMAKIFDEDRTKIIPGEHKAGDVAENDTMAGGGAAPVSPGSAASFFHHEGDRDQDGIFSQDEGLSSATEPATPTVQLITHDSVIASQTC